MDFVYAPPPASAKKRESPGGPSAGLLGLPVHLPNSLPTHMPNSGDSHIGQSDSQPIDHEESDIDDEETSTPKEAIYIQGTTISLQTDEDIAKWIEERKKKWPSRKNIEAKEAQKATKRPLLQDTKNTKKPRNVCKFFSQHNKCKFGTKCKNVHEQPDQQSSANTKLINGMTVHVPQRFHNEMYTKETASGSLYKMLVQKDLYEHENNKVLEFLRFLDERKLIDHNASM